jgi:hypothetical protein
MNTSTVSPSLARDSYGALDTQAALSPEQQGELKQLITRAVDAGLLPKPYVTTDKRETNALNLDPYDVLLSRKHVKAVIVQVRTFWRHKRKGYTRLQKSYLLVSKVGRKVTATEVDSATCVKRAKNTEVLGQLVGHYLGGAPVKCKASAPEPCGGFKVVAREPDGRLVSAYDGSEYTIGAWRKDVAVPNHGGGLYFYRDEDQAASSTERGETFAACVAAGKQLVLCRVKVAGRTIEYSGGKLAASRLCVSEVLRLVEFGIVE